MNNTKLAKEQKKILKEMRQEFDEAGGIMVQSDYVTIAFLPTCRGNGTMSVAVRGSNELKGRKKVGQYNALSRALYGEGIIHRMPESYEKAMAILNSYTCFNL